MLILTRKAGESLYIGDDIKLTVLGIQGKQIKLGITLPDTMTVYREEVYALVADDNILARQSKKDQSNIKAMPNVREIETKIGVQEIAEDKIIHFPKGMIGYEEEQDFTLVPLGGDSPFFMLQSTKTRDLGFIVTDPYSFLSEYSVKLNEAEQAYIQAKDSQDVFVFVTVTIPHGKPDQTALNLSGPIFINYEKRIAMQVPQDVKITKVLISECVDLLKDTKDESGK